MHYVIKELYDMMRKGGELGKIKEIKSKAEQERGTNLERSEEFWMSYQKEN